MGLLELILLAILSQLLQGLPPQIKHQDHSVTVIDARNQPICFFLDTIGSVEVCKDALS
jgi:hypothetical protein